MNLADLSFSFLISLSPIIVVAIPQIILKLSGRDLASKIYWRFSAGFSIFWLAYFLFPSGMNLLVPSAEKYASVPFYDNTQDGIPNSTLWQPQLYVFLKYLSQLIANSFVIFLQYPLVILPVVFVLGPILSLGILFLELRREEKEKPLKEKLHDIQYDLETNPTKQILTRFSDTDWVNEKELFKILLAILPISLFLMMTFLDILGYRENPSVLQGTSIGWFLEIFFVYIATVVFCVHLLFSSRISYKGRYVGERLRQAMVQSLSTVGAFLSVIAIVLFLVDFPDQIFVVAYFTVYFVMMCVFFILFLDLFEPISIFMLAKLIEFVRTPRMRASNVKVMPLMKIILLGLGVNTVLALGIWFSEIQLSNVFDNYWTLPYLMPYLFTVSYAVFLFLAATVIFTKRWGWHILLNSFLLFLAGFIFSFFVQLWYLGFEPFVDPLYQLIFDSWYPYGVGRKDGNPYIFNVPATFAGTFIVSQSWMTSTLRFGEFSIGGMSLGMFIPELSEVPVSFPDILGYLAIPYNVLHPLTAIALFGMLGFLLNREFIVHTSKKGDFLKKAVFSERDKPPDLLEAQLSPDRTLLSVKDPIIVNNILGGIANQMSEVLSQEPHTLADLSESAQLSLEEIHQYMELIAEAKKSPEEHLEDFPEGFFSVFNEEYSHFYEEVNLDSLHVMMTDGRSCFTHLFTDESTVEPALVAGLFAAITSFAKEAVRSEQLLRTIDHGDVVLTIEYGERVFGAVFASTQSTQLRKQLRNFMDRFEEKHGDELPNWLGDMSIFQDDHEIVYDIFDV